jgi:cytoskeletal protein RodZ
MKAPENPHRLVHDPRFRQWLASLAERRVESERLEKSGRVIRERIDELASKVSAASWIERTLWSRRFARVAVLVFLLVGMAAGAAHLWYSFRRAEPPSSPSRTGRALAINTEPEPEQPPEQSIEEPEPPKVKPQSSKNIVRPVPVRLQPGSAGHRPRQLRRRLQQRQGLGRRAGLRGQLSADTQSRPA